MLTQQSIFAIKECYVGLKLQQNLIQILIKFDITVSQWPGLKAQNSTSNYLNYMKPSHMKMNLTRKILWKAWKSYKVIQNCARNGDSHTFCYKIKQPELGTQRAKVVQEGI